MATITRITLPLPGLEQLRNEAHGEGYNFIERLVPEWESGINCFDGPGETLLGVIDAGLLVAVGGLNRDPFAGDKRIGRIRRVYVRQYWRGKGIGEALVNALVSHARLHFHAVRLRAENPAAARLYERLGFLPIENPDATHILSLTPQESHPPRAAN
jgi:GNAT superfamily N-acetyltransferase